MKTVKLLVLVSKGGVVRDVTTYSQASEKAFEFEAKWLNKPNKKVWSVKIKTIKV